MAANTTLNTGSVTNAFQYIIPATGIWFLSYSFTARPTGVGVTLNTLQTYIQNNTGGTTYAISSNMGVQSYIANAQYFAANTGSAIIPCTSGDSWAVKYFIDGTGATTSNQINTFNLVRIA
jgi:hypothetical protein